MSDVDFKELKYGFKYGDATVERHISDEKKGWIVLGLETSKHRLQIYVTKTGKVRIHDEDGKEWLPSNGGNTISVRKKGNKMTDKSGQLTLTEI